MHSFTVAADTPCEFPYIHESTRFIYRLIDNWMDPTGDGNCRFLVVSYFVNGDVELGCCT